MKRLLGLRKQQPPKNPTTISDCISNVDKRADEVEKKVNKCENDLRKLNEQLKNTRSASTKQMLQQKALRILQQKKAYESQLDGLRQQSFNMDQATNALQTAIETKVTVAAMKAGVSQMKKEFEKIKIDEIEDLQDEIADVIEVSDEVQEALGRGYSMPNVDEDELQAEFDALGDEIALDESSHEAIEINTPNVPIKEPGTSAVAMQNSDGISVDEYGLPIISPITITTAEKLRKD